MRRHTTPEPNKYMLSATMPAALASRSPTDVRSWALRGALLGSLGVLAASSVLAHTQTPARSARLDGVDRVVEGTIAAGQTPGAVVLVGRGAEVLHFEAYGARATVPSREPMTLDTVFDLASLTKVVATTTAMMTLVEQGRVRLNDPVSAYVPGFERYGKGAVTVGHLMAHISGLRPDLDLADPWKGYDTAIALACDEVLTSAPGERFIYSDINYFLLGEIVRVTSGEPLDVYTRKVVFAPLAMRDTGFLPAERLRARIAPTERCDEMDQWPCKRPGAAPLRGVVHDPTARRMGGVAGHAGLFGTASDLARFARMLLAGGALDGVRVLAPATVARMTSRATPPGMTAVRGLGWDIDTSYSSPRGELFPVGLVRPHRLHWHEPLAGSGLRRLRDYPGQPAPPRRGRRHDVASRAGGHHRGRRNNRHGIGASRGNARADGGALQALPPTKPVLAGIDVLARDGFAPLRGRKVGLLTNHTGVDRAGTSTIDILHRGLGSGLVALFSPEHGIRGNRDEENVASEKDARTGLTIHSLYGATRRPTDDMLKGLDTLVVDLADVGTRFYTYHTTVGYLMEEAAKRKMTVVILDRPNPINGWQIEGPLPDGPVLGSMVAYHALPVRHGLTMGELARLLNAERGIGADLT